MLNQLLWRCPICKAEEAIVHRRRRFRSDHVHCDRCGSAWDLIRVPGGNDYRFKAVAGSMKGVERPLAEWYDMMREGFALVPRPDSPIALEPGEPLYLQGRPTGMMVPRNDDRFQDAIAKLPQPEPPSVASKTPQSPPSTMINIGGGDLFLTDRRLILVHQGQRYDWPLVSLRSVATLLDRFVMLRHEGRHFENIEFLTESILKWRAYLELALRPIVQEHGFKLHMAYD